MSDTISIKVDGKERELFMSFGLLTALCNIIENPVRVTAIAVDRTLREQFLNALLAIRKPSGKILEAVADIDDIDISIKDVEKLLEWSGQHVLDFFLLNIKVANQLMLKNDEMIKALQYSPDGPVSSTSKPA